MGDRIRKINELVREEVSKAIIEVVGKENFITVTAVETTDDLKHALIWVSILGDEERGLSELLSHKSEIQHLVTGKMSTRYTPKLTFKIDHSPAYVEKIETLLKDDKR